MGVLLKTLLLGAAAWQADALPATDKPGVITQHQLNGNTPRRMIVLSRGRGGSLVLAQTIAVFANSDPRFLHNELFGGNPLAMEDVENPTELMAEWFDNQTKAQPEADLVGFKWKPDVYSDAYDEAWDWVVQHNVSVVWMTRNLLDHMISGKKHQEEDENQEGGLSAHCKPDDEACIEEHKNVKVHLNASTLVSHLTHDLEFYEERLSNKLDHKGVNYLRVSFEELFVVEDEGKGRQRLMLRPDSDFALASWNRIFSFLGLPSVRDYATIQDEEPTASTHPGSNCDSIENLQEVQTALTGTRFADLLGCSWQLSALRSCHAPEQNAREEECAAAVTQVASSGVVAERVVDLGSDSRVPAGCSYDTKERTAVFNKNKEGGSWGDDDGNPHRLICRIA